MATNWEYWQNLSKDGKVCGIMGCGETPKNQCPICKEFYCMEHVGIHYHVSAKENVYWSVKK